jgi:hypothetical protein
MGGWRYNQGHSTEEPRIMTDSERRRFFRIEDSVHLGLRVIPEAELAERVARLENNVAGSFGLMTGITALTQTVAACLRRIENRDPDVADYLKVLDRKIDLLARAFLSEEADIADKPARAVNLSAGGMAVHSREAMAEGTLLEIRLLLLPSYTGIVTYGAVVGSRPVAAEDGPDTDPEFPYLVRIDFSFMREPDRDALIRHILLKQGEWLRRRRERTEQGQ